MATYKINGYDWQIATTLEMDGDRTTADSFEAPAEVVEGYSYTWPNGVVEYDLLAPVQFKPRLFTFKGTLYFNNLADYLAGRTAVFTLIRQNYVTLEMVEIGVKANAKIKTGITWHRLTHLTGRIAVAVQFQFDEVLQSTPFKDFGTYSFEVDDNRDLIATTAAGSLYNFSLDTTGHLIRTVR